MTTPHPDEIQHYVDCFGVEYKRAKMMAKFKIDQEVRIDRKNENEAIRWLHYEMGIPITRIVMWHGGRFIVSDPGIATMLKLKYA